MTDKKVEMPDEIWVEVTDSPFSEMIVGDWTSEEYGGVQQTPYLRKDLVVRKSAVEFRIGTAYSNYYYWKNKGDEARASVALQGLKLLESLLNGGKDNE